MKPRTKTIAALPLLAAGLAALAAGTAAAAEIPARSAITGLVIYPDRAAVTRQAALDLAAGGHAVVFAGLPATLVANSLRASGRGTAAVRILGLETAVAFEEAALLPEVKRLQAEVEAAEHAVAETADRLAVLEAQEKFLASLEASTRDQAAREIAAGRPDVAGWEKAMDFVGTKLGALKSARLALQPELRSRTAALEAARRRLEQAQPAAAKESRTVTVLLEAASPGAFTLELTYTVTGAGWQPSYTLRALPESGEIDFGLVGTVVQGTGEDWARVKAALSTASPARSAAPPGLSPWELDIYAPPPPAPRPARATAAGAVLAKDEAAAEAPREAEIAAAAIVESGLHLNFELLAPLDAPSDRRPHRVPIDGRTLPAVFDYLAIPKTREAAYLRASLTNALPYPLLPGAADLFILEDFVGAARLPATAIGEEAKLFFGEDPQIKVTREQTAREKSTAGLLSRTERVRVAYRITVQNFRRTAARVEVRDQLPVSRNEKIQLRDVKISPAAARSDEDGVLTWTLELPPGGKQEIVLDFTVEYPRDARVLGL